MSEPKKTLVEGLKVEGESWRDALCRVPEAVRRLWWSMYLSGDVAEQLEQAIVAAQHLKREQEGRCTCVVMTPRNIYPGGRHLDDSCPVHTIQSREQEPALREIVYKAIFDGCTHIEQTARSDGKCEVCWGVACYVSQALAAQPPQELVSLHEALKWALNHVVRTDEASEEEDAEWWKNYKAARAALTRGAVGGTK